MATETDFPFSLWLLFNKVAEERGGGGDTYSQGLVLVCHYGPDNACLLSLEHGCL